jgi:hypothetical protein
MSSAMSDGQPTLRPYSIIFRGSVDTLRVDVESRGGRMYVPFDQIGSIFTEAVAVLPAGISMVTGPVSGQRLGTCEIQSVTAFFLPY